MVITAVTMAVIMSAVLSVETRVLPSPGNQWSFSTVYARVKSGAGAIEFDQNAWLTGGDLIVEIANTTVDDVDVVVGIKTGPSPCGDYVTVHPRLNTLKILKKSSNTYLISERIPFSSVMEITLRVTGVQCKIESDPRIFVGSVQTPTIEKWNVVK